jgi:hypothetical protein
VGNPSCQGINRQLLHSSEKEKQQQQIAWLLSADFKELSADFRNGQGLQQRTGVLSSAALRELDC